MVWNIDDRDVVDLFLHSLKENITYDLSLYVDQTPVIVMVPPIAILVTPVAFQVRLM